MNSENIRKIADNTEAIAKNLERIGDFLAILTNQDEEMKDFIEKTIQNSYNNKEVSLPSIFGIVDNENKITQTPSQPTRARVLINDFIENENIEKVELTDNKHIKIIDYVDEPKLRKSSKHRTPMKKYLKNLENNQKTDNDNKQIINKKIDKLIDDIQKGNNLNSVTGNWDKIKKMIYTEIKKENGKGKSNTTGFIGTDVCIVKMGDNIHLMFDIRHKKDDDKIEHKLYIYQDLSIFILEEFKKFEYDRNMSSFLGKYSNTKKFKNNIIGRATIVNSKFNI